MDAPSPCRCYVDGMFVVKYGSRSLRFNNPAPTTRTSSMPKTTTAPAIQRIAAVEAETLVQTILYGIREKKGVEIAVLHLGALKNTVAEYYIICSGGSDKQCQAIADSVEDEVRKAHNEKPWHVEGASRGEWILMDYVNVVVHVFIPRAREFYQLEELWADAPTERWAE